MRATFALDGPAQLQQEVRKSRFVAHAAPIESVAAALAFIAAASIRDATHNCWAYRIGTQYRFNDDGEPAGTAGKPILQAIDGQSFDHVAVVVTRWFGGVKLGAGGLVRAYGGCAAACLRGAPKHTRVERVVVRVRCDFSAAAQLRARLAEFEAIKRDEGFDDGHVELILDVPATRLAALQIFVRDATRGRASMEVE